MTLGADYDFDDQVSAFMFANQMTGLNSQVGIGCGYVLSESVLKFPWRNKVSLALVQDSGKGAILSFRHKFEGYVDKIGYRVTTFLLGYTYTIDYVYSVRAIDGVDFIIKGFYDDKSKINQSALGVEIKL